MAAGTIVPVPERRWACPSCTTTKVTREARPHQALHHCRGLNGMVVPLVQVHGLELARHAARHVIIERGDWIGKEKVQHGGIMAVHTERADGSHDTTVYAPTAVAGARS